MHNLAYKMIYKSYENKIVIVSITKNIQYTVIAYNNNIFPSIIYKDAHVNNFLSFF